MEELIKKIKDLYKAAPIDKRIQIGEVMLSEEDKEIIDKALRDDLRVFKF